MQHDKLPCARRGLAGALFGSLLAASTPAHADYPIASHRYLADPGSLVFDGRVYLYNSNDDDNPVSGGYQMKSIVCVSSSDLKNWTDHGEVLRVPASAAWAGDSWAPAAIAHNGKIYLYFGNNANGVGVASSTSPTGPFTDAKGSALVDASTPGASGSNSWLFDPSVFVDSDGQAYLSFGGNGDDNARVISLNSDLVSVRGSATALSVKDFFEASWLFKRKDLYYFTYSTNPATGMRIDYLTSKTPSFGYVYRGVVADQPPSNSGNNNHHSDFEFNGNWYHAYHNRFVAAQAGIATTYRRNLGLERLDFADDGAILQVSYTVDGVTQLASLNPYLRVEAETTNAQSGIETEPCSEGGMAVTSLENGDYIKVRGVDFAAGAKSFSARVAAANDGGTIELSLDSRTAPLIGTCSVAATGSAQTWATATCAVSGATGIRDLYLKFSAGSGQFFKLNHWQFTAIDENTGGTAGAGSGPVAASGMGAVAASGAGSPTDTGDHAGCGCFVGPGARANRTPMAMLIASLLVLRSRGRRRQRRQAV